MTAGAVFGKDGFASFELGLIFGEIGIAAGRVLQFMRVGRFQKEERHVRRLRLRCFPVTGVLARYGYFNWRNFLAAD